MASSAATGRTHRPRADMLRNRERIVDAARETFVELGPEAPLDLIAHRAGVGNATLYRHFAERGDLIRTVVFSVMDQCSDLADTASATEDDPFAALRVFVHGAADAYIGALCPMLSTWMDDQDQELLDRQERLTRSIETLVLAAQRAGSLRSDVTMGDLAVAMAQLARPAPGTGCPSDVDYIHRHLEILLDGLRAPGRTPLPGTPMAFETLTRSGGPNR